MADTDDLFVLQHPTNGPTRLGFFDQFFHPLLFHAYTSTIENMNHYEVSQDSDLRRNCDNFTENNESPGSCTRRVVCAANLPVPLPERAMRHPPGGTHGQLQRDWYDHC